MSEKLSEKFEKGYKHFLNCIDFGKCYLDAKAIQFMNEVPGQVVQKLKEIESNEKE